MDKMADQFKMQELTRKQLKKLAISLQTDLTAKVREIDDLRQRLIEL